MCDGLACGAATMPKTCTEMRPSPRTAQVCCYVLITIWLNPTTTSMAQRTDNACKPHVSGGKPRLTQNVVFLPLKGKAEFMPIGQKKDRLWGDLLGRAKKGELLLKP